MAPQRGTPGPVFAEAMDAEKHRTVILNCACLVRHYWRGARTRMYAAERRAALERLGAAALEALEQCERPEETEAVLRAIVDGLAPHDEQRF